MPIINSTLTFIRRQPRWRQIAVVAVLIIGGLWWWRRAEGGSGTAPTFEARRGPLEITVLEGGSLSALESQEIKCEVRVGYQGTKILRIVEEGYFVTEDDVRTNKVLCELDSSELQKQIAQQEIQYQSALASLTDAEQNYEIQLGQNESDLKAAEQKTRFARMDFDKFLGDTVTAQIVQQLGLDALLAASATNDVAQTTHATESARQRGITAAIPGTETVSGPAAEPPEAAAPPAAPAPIVIDFARFATIEALGDGEAKQKLRKLEDDLQVAQKELGQTRTALEGTKRLFEKGFVPRTEMVRDEIAHESSRLKVQTAETARALYLKYEFPKAAEESLSKFTEAVRELDKARRVAISKLAQARARLNSAQGQHAVQLRQRTDLNEQLGKCVIVAKKSGLVVYGGGRDQEYYGSEERIREGATVRERQAIITIPDMSRMAVNVKIHESYIKKVKRGLKARITVDAFPDEVLSGEVIKVGVLPDSQNRWMNPDLKVYLTTIAIDGSREWVKPGMSAKVEILVNRLADVVHIPVQAVFPDNGKPVCYVMRGFKPERREIQVGEFTDEFIEIKSGLREGERVLLRPPVELEHRPGAREPQPEESFEAEPTSAPPV
jgi:HlyD family secretion protein